MFCPGHADKHPLHNRTGQLQFHVRVQWTLVLSLHQISFCLLHRNEISGAPSETPAWLKVKPCSFWPVPCDPSPDLHGTDTLQSNIVCSFSVHFGVRFLELEFNYCIKTSTDFCSHLPLICLFYCPKGLKWKKGFSLKKLEMVDPPQRTNLGKKIQDYHYSQHRGLEAESWQHVCTEERTFSVWVPENAASCFQSKINLCLKHDMTTSLSEVCHGEMTTALRLAWWLEQQSAALKQQAQLASICWLKNKPSPLTAEHWTWAERYQSLQWDPCSRCSYGMFTVHHQGQFCLPPHLQLHIPASSLALSTWWVGSQAWDIQKATKRCQWGQLGGVSTWLQGNESEGMK